MHSQTDTLKEGHASIGDVVGIREQTVFQKMLASQAFWVAIALFVLVVFMTFWSRVSGRSTTSPTSPAILRLSPLWGWV